MKEKIIELYYDHYKDTFENLKVYIQRRNYYTIIILCFAIILSFQITNPEKTNEISNELIKKNIGEIKIDFKHISNILHFALLWVVILYYQIIFLIEKHYKYIHDIEETLSQELAPLEIRREGKNYLDHYPWLSSVVDKIYTILFPVSLIIMSVIKWHSEYIMVNQIDTSFFLSSIFLFGIVLTSILYISNRHFNDFNKKPENNTKSSSKNMFSNYEKTGKILIIFSICFTIFFGAEFIFNSNKLTNGPIEPSIWGQFGDVVGGFVGTIIALVGVLLLFETLKQQRNVHEKQQVETKFFELLKLHRDNVLEMQSKNERGRSVFIDIKEEFHELYELISLWYTAKSSNLSDHQWKTNVAKIAYLITFFGLGESPRSYLKAKIKKIISNDTLYDNFYSNCLIYLIDNYDLVKLKNQSQPAVQKSVLKYSGYQSILGHYFRHLFQTVSYINQQPNTVLSYKEKYVYIKTLRAQLGTFEQAVFFYNSISSLGEPWELSEKLTNVNDKIITKYNLIKNVPFGFTRALDPKSYYPDIFYEFDEQPPANRKELEKSYI